MSYTKDTVGGIYPAPVRQPEAPVYVFPQGHGGRSLPTYSLALASTPAPARDNAAIVKLVVAAIAIVIVLAVAYWLWKRSLTPNPPPRRPPSKMSTREMAQALYRRLEERGGVSDTTMRSLQQIGRRKTGA